MGEVFLGILLRLYKSSTSAKRILPWAGEAKGVQVAKLAGEKPRREPEPLPSGRKTKEAKTRSERQRETERSVKEAQ